MEYNPLRICTDVFYFDGASNVQKAGEVLMARFPCSFCFHGGTHVVSLFFSSIAKIKPVEVCCMFALLGCIQSIDPLFFLFYSFWFSKHAGCVMYLDWGGNHGIYAQFMAKSAIANKGCKVGLLQGAGTQMALWFYAMVSLLCLRQPLVATIHWQKIIDLNLNNSVRAAVHEHDIKDNKFWKFVYLLLHAVFPTLRLLCYCNKSTPAMDKIFILSHRTTLALEKSEEFLNNRNLSGSLRSDSNLTQEGNILGEGGNMSDEENVVFQNDPPIWGGKQSWQGMHWWRFPHPTKPSNAL